MNLCYKISVFFSLFNYNSYVSSNRNLNYYLKSIHGVVAGKRMLEVQVDASKD